MAVVTPTAKTFTTVVAAASFASAAAPGTTQTLDLTTKFGAELTIYFGRTVTTALTRAAVVAVRKTFNNTWINPATNYDVPSSTAAAPSATTLNGALSISATTALLTSGTGFAAGQTVCMSSGSSRIEFAGITDLTTNTITFDRSGGLRIAHNSGDTITNAADVLKITIPGGDVYEITPINNSGQTMIIRVDAEVYNSDTIT